MGYLSQKNLVLIFELVLIILIGLFMGSSGTTSPFIGDVNVIDEGQFAAWANFMIHGKLLFKDMYVVYGPFYVWPVYALFTLFTPSAFLVRTYLVTGGVLAIITINIFLRYISVGYIGRFIAITLLLLLPGLFLRQGVGWLFLLFLVIAETTSKRGYYILTGIVAAVSFLISPDIGIFCGIILFIYFVHRTITHSLQETWQLYKVIIAGYCIPFMLLILWAGRENWLVSYVTSTTRQLIEFSGMRVPNGQGLPNLFSLSPHTLQIAPWVKYVFSKEILLYIHIGMHSFILLYFTLKVLLKKFTQLDKVLFCIFIYSLWLVYVCLRTPDYSHFFYTLSPMIVILAIYTEKIIESFTYKNIRSSRNYASLALLLFFAYFFVRLLYSNHPQIIKSISIPYAVIHNPNNPSYIGHITISSNQKNVFVNLHTFAQNNTSPQDTIFIFTDEPFLYLVMNRDNATKYVLPFAAVTKTMRLDIISDLQKNKPKYIIMNTKPWNIDNVSTSVRLPEVVVYIHHNYTKSNKINDFLILRRNI